MTQSHEKFFDSELIARLARMELTAKRIVDGFLAGKNKSSRHGFSVEFVEHREYSPGDDLRHLDWKVLGRMDRYYIKRYEEETNITAVLLVDASKSMTYGSKSEDGAKGDGTDGGLSKFEIAATAASALGYLLNRQRDAVGLALFDEELRTYIPPSAKLMGLANAVAKMKGSTPRGKTNIEGVVQRLLGELPGRSLIIMASDLFVSPDEFDAVLKLLQYNGHDALVLQTLDKAEREFPFRQNMMFRGLEDDQRLLAEPQRLRKQYLEALEVFLGKIRKSCERAAFDYQLVTSGEPLAPLLTALLAARSRRGRVARRGTGS